MVMLTQLLRFHVADSSGQAARLVDLCIALLDDDYPPVTHLLFRHDNELRQVNCDDVGRFDWKRQRINVESLDATSIHEDCDVLLVRDIMDSLVLDLLGRRTTRVCDLQLNEKDGDLRLIGVDAGLIAMIRRITRGAIGSVTVVHTAAGSKAFTIKIKPKAKRKLKRQRSVKFIVAGTAADTAGNKKPVKKSLTARK